MENHKIISNHQCKYFLEKKQRFCRMLVKPEVDYCAEHLSSDQTTNEDVSLKRIPCPLDNKHTCYVKYLKKHLKICNARPKDNLPYIQKDFNLEGTNSESNKKDPILLSSFTEKQITDVISHINQVHDEIMKDNIQENFLTHSMIENEILQSHYGHQAKKHMKQASAILGLLEYYKLNRTNTCYIEFGAGRGGVTFWLSKANINENGSFLLIEKSSPKHKHDNKLNKNNHKIKRIRADISNLILDNIEMLQECNNIVGVAKHLCGDATGVYVALRCLNNSEKIQTKISGCVMTLCCHHRCKWSSYTGREFLENINFSQDNFEILRCLSSWATSGYNYYSQNNQRFSLNKNEREMIGKKAKNILNWGRLMYLRKTGYTAMLHYYVNEDISLENVCLIGFKHY